jgi:hypothetical protein
MRFPRHTLIIAAVVVAPAFALSIVAVAAAHHPSMNVQHLALSPASTSDAPKQAILGATTTTNQPTTVNIPAAATTHSSSTTSTHTDTSSPTPTTSNPAPTGSPTTNNQPSSVETTGTIHIGGYPPATGTALTTDFENPVYVPCGGQYPSNAYCPTSLYEWVATKGCTRRLLMRVYATWR